MQDAWRAYLELALGLTDASRKKAQQVVGDLANRGGATRAQLQALAEELLGAGTANRESLGKLVRYEVDRALGMVGLATTDEVNELTTRVQELERRLREARVSAEAGSGAPAAPAENRKGPLGPGLSAPYATPADGVPSATRLDAPAPLPRTPGMAKKVVAKKAVAKKAVAKKAVAKKAVAPKGATTPAATSTPTPASPAADSAPTTAVVAPATSGTAVAKKASTGKAVAKKAPSGRAVAKKSATGKAAAKKATTAKPETRTENAGGAGADRTGGQP